MVLGTGPRASCIQGQPCTDGVPSPVLERHQRNCAVDSVRQSFRVLQSSRRAHDIQPVHSGSVFEFYCSLASSGQDEAVIVPACPHPQPLGREVLPRVRLLVGFEVGAVLSPFQPVGLYLLVALVLHPIHCPTLGPLHAAYHVSSVSYPKQPLNK